MSEEIYTSALDVEGEILRCGRDWYFRVYQGGPTVFKDYKILHFDIKAKILDEDAYLYEDDNGANLNYSKETLGQEE